MPVVKTTLTDTRRIDQGNLNHEFGEFEAISGYLTYAVNLSDRTVGDRVANIADIQYAPKSASQVIEFRGDFSLIRPVNKPIHRLLVDVPNRGRPIAARMFNRVSPQVALDDPFSPGDGFLFQHAFGVLSIGWQFDVRDGMKLDVPNALIDEKEIRGEVVCQMQSGRDTHSLFFGQTLEPSYLPTGLGRLYRRSHSLEDYEELPTSEWRFGRLKDGEFHHSDSFICSEKGFQKGLIYTLVYETVGAPIVGLGLIALRDATSFLRYEVSELNPSGAEPKSVIGFGASQTGRVLRHFLYEGLNEDEQGRIVFDAVIPHIAGGQRGDFNHRFAQPGSMGVPAKGQLFPYALRESENFASGEMSGLADADTTGCKVISTNTSWEYWRGDAALIHVTTDGARDIVPLANERIYLFSGTHHINAVLPPTDRFALTGEQVSYTMNVISYTPLIRAVLINAQKWVEDEIPPPDSKIPTLANQTLVDRETVIEKFAQRDAFTRLPDPNQLTRLCCYDLGDEVKEGVCRFPAILREPYAALVADVDESLNESAGIRLPEIVLSIGVHTGWNPRHEDHGAMGQNATFAGLSYLGYETVNFATEEDCRRAVGKVTTSLIQGRYVLSEDYALVMDNAMERFQLVRRSRSEFAETELH